MEATRPDFLTTREVAALLRVHERKVHEMAAAGDIPLRRVTGKLLFPRIEIERWLGGGAAARPTPVAAAVVAGGHDPLLDWAIRESGSGLATMFDDSLDGLDRLAAASERLGAGAGAALVGWARRRRGLIHAGDRAPGGAAPLRSLRLARRQAHKKAAALGVYDVGETGVVRWNGA